MKEILIIGAGGFAKEVYFIIKSSNLFNIKGFVSNKLEDKNKVVIEKKRVIGDDKTIIKNFPGINIFIAIGDIQLRKKIVDYYKKAGFGNFPTIVHSNCLLADNVLIGEGTILYPRSVIMPDVKIGNFSMINNGTFIAHDSIIGDFNNLNPGAIINGGVKLGGNVLIGAGAIIRQGIKITDNVTIGMGAVVTKDILIEGTYFGNPAKKIF